MTSSADLPSWRDGAARQAIADFVEQASALPPQERVAVFDNDGTLWCEMPMPVQMHFILRRLAEMAESTPELRTRQPWQAAYERDHAWFAGLYEAHYAGDDSGVRVLGAAILSAYEGLTVDEYDRMCGDFLRSAEHPTLGRPFRASAYAPMRELLDHLAAKGFACYIASGGGQDFVRPVSDELYGIARDRVIGSSVGLEYRPDEHGGTVVRRAEAEGLSDGPAKPVSIWARIGRRPLLAAGNSNGDVPMLEFAGGDGRPSLRLLVHHDDAEREFAYDKGAETALERAAAEGWTVVSMKDDWSAVFAG